MVHGWLNFVHKLLYKPYCLLCGSPAKELDLCAHCHPELPWNRHACAICAYPLPAGTAPGARCGACLQKTPSYDAAFSLFRYDYPVDRLLLALKFHRQLPAGRLLGQLLADALTARETPLPAAVIPVPLHPARLRERGFNQAAELARPLGRTLNRPVRTDLVRRIRPTRIQSRLDARERRRNVRGAFSIQAPPPRHVAILDDVVTTGSTVAELARTLRKAGVERIDVWSLARA